MLKTLQISLKQRQFCTRSRLLNQTNMVPALQPGPYPGLRTKINNPANHTLDQEGQYYTINQNDVNALFSHNGLPSSFINNVKTFTEACLMIRRPALELIQTLKTFDFSKPNVRFVLYGPHGSGKSLTVAHVVHYAYLHKFLIVHIPGLINWTRWFNDGSECETLEGYVDVNIDAAAWLVHFQSQNRHWLAPTTELTHDKTSHLSVPLLRTTREHTLTICDVLPEGTPLNDIVEFGITRIKYACGCVRVVFEEIKELSRRNQCRTLVALLNAHLMYQDNPKFRFRGLDWPPTAISLCKYVDELIQPDWNNVVTLFGINDIRTFKTDPERYRPMHLLGKKGFDRLNPFIPVYVPTYTKKELTNCLDYYRERLWIRSYDGLDEEIGFISSMNPLKVMQICDRL